MARRVLWERPAPLVVPFDPYWDDEDIFDDYEPDPEPQVFMPEYGWVSESDAERYKALENVDLDAFEEWRRQRIAERNEY